MDETSATPSGAETSARPDDSAQPTLSIHDRLKAHLAPEPEQKPQPVASGQEPAKPVQAKAEPPEEVEAEPDEVEAPAEEEEAEPLNLSNIAELAEATGLELDKIMDLDIPTKIDGKEGKTRLRDLIKSFQLEGHLNQKLMAHADEKKAFETERQTFQQQTQHKTQQMDAALQVATRLLDAEFGQINWQELQASDRLEFNQKVVEYQQRQQALSYLADQIGNERKQSEAQAAQQQQAYLADQMKLMESKLPEWADAAKRQKDIADMATVLNDAYGVTEEELRSVADHRQILIARDAWKWQQLQKAKPAIVNKVKTAPRLLKPGTTQSRTEQGNLAAKSERAKLQKTGSVRDATPLLKRLLFNQN